MPKKEVNPNIVSAVAAYKNETKTREPPRKQNIVHSSNKKSENKEKDQKEKLKEM